MNDDLTFVTESGRRAPSVRWGVLLGLLLAPARSLGCAAVPTGASVNLEFRVAVGAEVEPELQPDLQVTLTLLNVGDAVAYVSPVIGQMCSSMAVWAQRRGVERPMLLYRKDRINPAIAFEGLFALQPRQWLSLEKEICSAGSNLEPGEYALWAELDCTNMNKTVPQAWAGKLTSNRVHFGLRKRR